MNGTSKVGLFGTETRTQTLLVIHMLGESHASEIAKILDRRLSRIQAAVESLERAGVVIGIEEGKARRLRLNPRYPALKEVKNLLDALGRLDSPLQLRLAERRRRPRRAGKEL